MKKLFTIAMFALCSLAVYAQQSVTQFLGIPVDGTEAEMVRKLKAKGFEELPGGNGTLKGEFNGEKVYIGVLTQDNKVWRIAVMDEAERDEVQIRLRFNTLLEQFENNPRYISGLLTPQKLEEDEDIYWGISYEKKAYEASFLQVGDTAVLKKELAEKFDALPLGDTMDIEELKETVSGRLALISIAEKRSVWFRIVKGDSYKKFSIIICYDNECNKASGEDL